MHKIIPVIREIFNNTTILMIMLVALFSLLVDGPSFKDKGFAKEYKIVKAISYSYIAIGVGIWIFLKVV